MGFRPWLFDGYVSQGAAAGRPWTCIEALLVHGESEDQVAGADYSVQSFEQAAQHSYGTWKGVEADYLESNPMLNQLGDQDANQEEAAKAKAVSEGIEQQWAARRAAGGGH